MFHTISKPIQARMRHLEEVDARDREDGTSRMERLRQIPPETGQFLALLAASAPHGQFLEIGTSAGYSALWILLACQARGVKLTTFELLDQKIALAQETFHLAGMAEHVELIQGDAREYLAAYRDVAFCFIDAEKELYGDCYELVVPNMKSGGLLVADNAINHREALQPMLDRALSDSRVDALIVPIGKGELVCRKI